MEAARIALLQQMPIFGALSASTLELLLDATEEVRVPAKGYFFREGERGDELFVLESGRVAVRRHTASGDDITVRQLGPGDCFGEMAVLDLAPRSASMQALDDCLALKLPVARLHRLYQEDLEQFALIQMNLARELSRRLRLAMDRLGAVYDHMMT